jgi:hypothetical protein
LDDRAEQPVLHALVLRQIVVGHKARVRPGVGILHGAVDPAVAGVVAPRLVQFLSVGASEGLLDACDYPGLWSAGKSSHAGATGIPLVGTAAW